MRELGEPMDVLRLEETEPAAPGPGQVAVAVKAVGLNFPDLLQMRGGYQVKPPLPFTPGGEYSGVVAAAGEGVTALSVGDRVVAMGSAGLADQANVAARSAFRIPDQMSYGQAAALPVNYGTTIFALRDRAHLQPGEWLLVHAAAGGVGSTAVQVGRALGAKIIGTAGGPEKKAVLEGLGVDVAIDYTNEDFVEVVKEATGGRGVDVIYDPVGGDTWDRSRKVIAWDGRMLVIGFTSGRIPDHPINHILLKNYSVVGVHWGASIARDPDAMGRHMRDIFTMFDDGFVDPLLFREVAFDEVPQAYTLLSSRGTYGKVVVTP